MEIENAKTKRCPFGSTGEGRYKDAMDRELIYTCITTECMAWEIDTENERCGRCKLIENTPSYSSVHGDVIVARQR